MQKKITPAGRLIVAADFEPSSSVRYTHRFWVHSKVIELARKLRGTGVTIKLNSALRACGYSLMDRIHEMGLSVFADLKLCDIPNTLEKGDGSLLNEAGPEMLTVMCLAGEQGIRALKNRLPNTEVLGVTVLTSLSEADTSLMFARKAYSAVEIFARIGIKGGADGLICSPKEVRLLRTVFGDKLTLNTPGIRPEWAIVPGDDQNPERISTPEKAILAGADRIVVGRPILNAEKPYDAVMRTIEEIASVHNT